jgi:hypothetical protein
MQIMALSRNTRQSRSTLHRVVVLVSVTLQAFAHPGAQRTNRGPDRPTSQTHDSMKRLVGAFAGSWSIHLSSRGSAGTVNESAGDGEETWRAGPGSKSLIEEYHSTGTEGEVTGLGVYWPAVNETGINVFWCDNTAAYGCRTLNSNAVWKEGRLVLSEQRYKEKKRYLFEEAFAFDSPDSFTQTLSEGESRASLKPFLTIRATRKKP